MPKKCNVSSFFFAIYAVEKLTYLIGFPLTVHTAVGGGSPLIPTSNFNIEFAVRVRSRMLRRSILGATARTNKKIPWKSKIEN
jgi:hypothetical protein